MRVIATLLLAVALPQAASAACFDDLGLSGCPNLETFPIEDLQRLSCQGLWLVRNSIYNDNGYCFRTQAAIDQFDNSDCSITDSTQLPFNRYEQANIDRIVRIERQKGCR